MSMHVSVGGKRWRTISGGMGSADEKYEPHQPPQKQPVVVLLVATHLLPLRRQVLGPLVHKVTERTGHCRGMDD